MRKANNPNRSKFSIVPNLKLQLLNALLFLVFTLGNIFIAPLFAQSPGLIVRPQAGGSITLLNPNGDSWASSGNSGFINNDSTESEIPFKGVPVTITETTGDLSQGPTGGFSEIVKPTPGHGFYVHSDGTNLYFRIRIGGIVSGAKGYSVLIDADSKFGSAGSNADPNFVASTSNNNGNAGFEWEVVLETTKRVAIYSVDGTSTPVLANSYTLATNSQVAVAFSTDSGNPDYFYDFVVPIAGFTGYAFPLTASTPLRMSATTVMSPGPATGGAKSDIYGVAAFTNANNAYTSIINNTPSFTATNLSTNGYVIPPVLTAAPVMTVPIPTGTSTVSGTWTRLDATKGNTATINLYKNGVLVGTTTVTSGGTWSIPGITATTGDVFYTTAQASGESVSPNSNTETVIGCTVANTSTTTGLNFTCSSDRGMMGNRPTNASVKLYLTTITGRTLFANDATGAYLVAYPTSTSWRYDDVNTQSASACTGGTADVAAGQYSITATETGKCESPDVYTGGCSLGSTTATPTITQTTLYTENTTVSGTCASGATVTYFKNGMLLATVVASGTSYTFNNRTLYNSDVVTIMAQSAGLCMSATVSRTVVQLTLPPIINTSANGTLVAGATTITGTSPEAAGTVVSIYESGILKGTATVQSNGTWSFTYTVVSGKTYYATEQASGAAVSVASATVSVQTNTTIVPTITGSYNENSNPVNGTLPSSFTGKVYLYLDGQKVDSVSVTSATTWSIPVNASINYRLYTGGVLTSTAMATGNAENTVTSNQVTISCAVPTTPSVSPTSSTICVNGTISYTLTAAQSGILYSVRDNTDAVNLGISGFGTGANLTLTTAAFSTPGTYSVRIKATSLSGAACESYTTVSVTVNAATVAGSVAGSTSVCTGTNSTNLSLSGHTGSITKWQFSTDNFSTATDVANTTTSLTATNLTATRQYRAVVQSGVCSVANTAASIITVDAASVSGTVTGNGTVCAGTNSTTLTLASNTGSVVKWQSSTNNFSTATDISNTTTSLTATNLTANTQYRALVQNGVCAQATTASVSMLVNAAGQWVGGTSGNWNVGANWCGGVPSASSNVSIPASSTVNISTANVTVNSINISTGGSLTMNGAYNLSIAAGGTFTNTGNFDATASTGKVIFVGNATVSGTVAFKNVDASGALDFGSASSIDGNFILQPGGSVSVNAPTYTCPAGTLIYNTGGVYTRGLEWKPVSTGSGYPANVIVQNNTTINFPANGNGFICNDLTVNAGSNLSQNYSGGSAALTVGRHVTINGQLSLGSSSGGDITLNGNWTRNTGGVFNHNNRTVTFTGSTDATITAPTIITKDANGAFGGETFYNLTINKAAASNSVLLGSHITVSNEIKFTKGIFDVQNNEVTLVSNASNTAHVANIPTSSGLPSGVEIRYGGVAGTGTGKFVVQRYLPIGSGPTSRRWRLLTAPLQATGAPNINEAWQEGVSNADKNVPVNPWPGFGTTITKSTVYNAADGYDQGSTNNASLYYLNNSGIWSVLPSTKSTTITDYEGYMLFARGNRGIVVSTPSINANSTTLEPKGRIKIGDVQKSLIANYQIIGNPYASAINFGTLTFNNYKCNGTTYFNSIAASDAGTGFTYYIWDPLTSGSFSVGKLITCSSNGDGTFAVTANNSGISNTGIIQSGSAFIINSENIGGTITFHETDKIISSSITGISSRPLGIVGMRAQLNTAIYSGTGTNSKLCDGVINAYHVNYNDGVDGQDAKKMDLFNSKETLSILSNNTLLAVERKSGNTERDTVFLNMTNLTNSSYEFKFNATNFDPSIMIYLEDRFSGNTTLISKTDTTTVPFYITSAAESFTANRFRIIYKEANVLPVTFSNVKASKRNKQAVIDWTVENEINIRKYEVEKSTDGSNFVLVNTTAANSNNAILKNYQWIDNDITSSSNYYRIKSFDQNESIAFSKIVLVRFDAVHPAITVFPNPVTDAVINLKLSNLTAGYYSATMHDVSGKQVYKATLQIGENQHQIKINTGSFLADGQYELQLIGNNISMNSKVLIKTH